MSIFLYQSSFENDDDSLEIFHIQITDRLLNYSIQSMLSILLSSHFQ